MALSFHPEQRVIWHGIQPLTLIKTGWQHVENSLTVPEEKNIFRNALSAKILQECRTWRFRSESSETVTDRNIFAYGAEPFKGKKAVCQCSLVEEQCMQTQGQHQGKHNMHTWLFGNLLAPVNDVCADWVLQCNFWANLLSAVVLQLYQSSFGRMHSLIMTEVLLVRHMDWILMHQRWIYHKGLIFCSFKLFTWQWWEIFRLRKRR